MPLGPGFTAPVLRGCLLRPPKRSNPLAAFFAKNPKLETALYFGIW